ncbi:hypothetical protein HaLaN_16984 [Haematococcus lacustris]|uniref:Uncharacterized protein n=1 Tax=Haematococcus lacustris TaxID=44745 RepID=A0A699ZLX7_HAELA|nr:hypothetical protein HaLaN_16984 [Haematococcus lacustris]
MAEVSVCISPGPDSQVRRGLPSRLSCCDPPAGAVSWHREMTTRVQPGRTQTEASSTASQASKGLALEVMKLLRALHATRHTWGPPGCAPGALGRHHTAAPGAAGAASG